MTLKYLQRTDYWEKNPHLKKAFEFKPDYKKDKIEKTIKDIPALQENLNDEVKAIAAYEDDIENTEDPGTAAVLDHIKGEEEEHKEELEEAIENNLEEDETLTEVGEDFAMRKKPAGHKAYTRITPTGKIAQIKEKPYMKEEQQKKISYDEITDYMERGDMLEIKAEKAADFDDDKQKFELTKWIKKQNKIGRETFEIDDGSDVISVIAINKKDVKQFLNKLEDKDILVKVSPNEVFEKARKKPAGHKAYIRKLPTGKIAQVKEKPYVSGKKVKNIFGQPIKLKAPTYNFAKLEVGDVIKDHTGDSFKILDIDTKGAIVKDLQSPNDNFFLEKRLIEHPELTWNTEGGEAPDIEVGKRKEMRKWGYEGDDFAARKKPAGHKAYQRITPTGKVAQVKEKPYTKIKAINSRALKKNDNERWEKLGIHSGSQLYDNSELSTKYLNDVKATYSKLLGDRKLNRLIYESLEDENFHALNEALATQGFYDQSVPEDWKEPIQFKVLLKKELGKLGEKPSKEKKDELNVSPEDMKSITQELQEIWGDVKGNVKDFKETVMEREWPDEAHKIIEYGMQLKYDLPAPDDFAVRKR